MYLNYWGETSRQKKEAQVLPEFNNEDKRDIIQLLIGIKKLQTGGPPGIILTKFLSLDDWRRWIPKFYTARKQEIRGLIGKGAFQDVVKSEVPNDTNILGGRLFLTKD